jgi:hypothetical protein
MRRALLLVLLLPALPLVLAAPPAFACSCAMASAQEYAERADVVVLGAVDEVDDSRARLRVDRVLKGDAPPGLEVINGNCNGPALTARQKGAFFLRYTDKGLQADLCGGSGFVKPQEVVAALGEGAVPNNLDPLQSEPVRIDSDEPAQSAVPTRFVVVAAALVILAVAVAGAVAVRRRRV